ncbi:hypothetical protein OPV22_015140 [Ensete ventricosum]|uniref:Uncharacterized protein n=1 Tax=Ensete ventricosum TaxID=4639 RepID=A0AAV8PL26_ENSVE|nr:hypothetical protein OPV22_015140 [Ensete ventricosum]
MPLPSPPPPFLHSPHCLLFNSIEPSFGFRLLGGREARDRSGRRRFVSCRRIEGEGVLRRRDPGFPVEVLPSGQNDSSSSFIVHIGVGMSKLSNS